MVLVLVVSVFCMLLASANITFIINASNNSGPHLPNEFLSLTIETITNENYHYMFPYWSDGFNTLAKGISPAFARYGGTSADLVIYETAGNITNNIKDSTAYLNLTVFSYIADFAERNNWKFVFGLNEQYRFTNNNTWNPSNSKQLLDAIKDSNKQNNNKSYVYAFELGNEPDAYPDHEKDDQFVPVSAQQEADDFHTLYNMIQNVFNYSMDDNFFIPQIWGNDICCAYRNNDNDTYQQQWLQALDQKDYLNEIDMLTFHHYYGSADDMSLSDYYSLKELDSLIPILQNITGIGSKYLSNQEIIIGETSSSSHGGKQGITDTFVDGFLWLDKLGLSSIYGIYSVCRQVFYHNNYALVNIDNNKNYIVTPDYWSSYLFKNLIGNKVIYVNGEFNKGRYLRIYAYCTRTAEEGNDIYDYKKGSITVLMINIYNETKTFNMDFIGVNGNNISYDEYHLTPNKGVINSSDILLNGKIIKMINSTTFPQLLPIHNTFGSDINIVALSYGFVVVSNADAAVCL